MSAPARRAVFREALQAELAHLARDRWDRLLLLVIPPVLMAVVAAMFSAGVIREIPVAVVDADHSTLSRAAIRNMEASPALRIAAMPLDLDAAWPLVRSGRVYSVAYLPRGLAGNALREPDAAIVYYNAAFQTVGAIAASAQADALTAAAQSRLQSLARDVGVPSVPLTLPAIQNTTIGNPQTNFELFLGGLVVPGILHLLIASAAVMAFGRELRGGSLAQWAQHWDGRLLQASLAKSLPYVVAFVAWGLVWLAWLCGWRGWGIAGSLPMLLAGLVVLMTATVALSALLVNATGDMDIAYSATAVYAGAAIAFSNGTLPLTHGPVVTQVWSALLPYTHYLRVQNAQMVMGADAGASLDDVGLLLGVTLGAGALALALAHRRARRQPKPEHEVFPVTPDRAGAAFIDTFRGIVHSLSVASLLILGVVGYAFYYPMAYAGQTAVKLPVAVVDQDHSPLSRAMVRALDATRAIDARTVAAGYLEAQHMLRNGRVDGVVVIPSGFESRLLSGQPHGIAIDVDGSHLVRASAIGRSMTATITGIVEARLAALDGALHVQTRVPSIVQRPLYNTSDGYGSYVVPAVACIILQQTLLLGSALVTAIRRRTRAAVLGTRGFIGLWGGLIVAGVLGNLFYFGFVFWFQDYPRMGNPLGMLCLVPLFAASTSALGLALGTCFDQPMRVMQLLVGTSVPLFFLGGSAWPPFLMPDWLVAVAQLSPATSAIRSFVQLNSAGATLGEVAPHAAVLAGLTIVYGWIAWKRLVPGALRARAGVPEPQAG